MKNAEQIRKRLDNVKQMKSYTEALNTLADIQYEIGMEACHERNEMKSEINQLHVLILGNGNPENSIVSRLSVVERNILELKDDMRQIKNKLLGSLNSQEDGIISKMDKTDAGLKSLEEKLTKLSNNLTWVLRLVGGAIVVELAIQLFKIAF